MDIKLALMCGSDIPIPECQITVHQPKIWEIALIGEEDFFIGTQCLNINKKYLQQDENVLGDINNFQIFMTIMTERETVDKKLAVFQIFQIIFPNYKVLLTPRSIIFSKEGQEENVVIDETNFNNLQNVLKEIFCLASQSMKDAQFNPANKKAQEIAEKLKRGRVRIAAEKGEQEGSMLSQYLSSLVVGVNSMSLEDCMNLTLYQLLDLIERYSLYVNWDIDIRSRLAGASGQGDPENWMKNIH